MVNKIGLFLGSLVLGLSLAAPQAQADEWNKKTVITVKEAMRIPSLTLQPGKYVLKLADSNGNRHIVQVFNSDESQILATILAIPNERLEPTGDTVLELWETPKGAPRALRAWFYPGDNFGQEFAYPKDEAAALTAEVHHEVPALSEEDQAALAKSSSGSVTPAENKSTTPVATEQPVTTTENPAQLPHSEADNTAQSAAPQEQPSTSGAPQQQPSTSVGSSTMDETHPSESTPGTTSTDTTATAKRELPRTASYLPIIGLSGFLAVGAATALRMSLHR
jgi:hypothetical protein